MKNSKNTTETVETTNVNGNSTATTTNLEAAIISVMQEVTYIQNDKTIGSGFNSFKTVSGEKLKTILQPILAKNGITIRQTAVNHDLQYREWEDGGKTKREYIFVAIVSYEIKHISGETATGESAGMGINQGDKAPGIALSFALRNFLLNTFVIPHGEDADSVGEPEEPQAPQKPKLIPGTELWMKGINAIKSGNVLISVIPEKYDISASDLIKLQIEASAAKPTDNA